MWPMFVIFWVIVQAVGALLQVRMFWVRWMFAVIRAALWRVVEYDKGAIAAVILIAIAALMIVKELLAPSRMRKNAVLATRFVEYSW